MSSPNEEWYRYTNERTLVTVLAAGTWNTNAELIEDMAELGYLDGKVLDSTYGRGVWWKAWSPEDFTPYTGNFLDMPFEDSEFDSVTYDPPYVSPGGRATTGLPDFYDRYGLKLTPNSPAGLQEVMNRGLEEVGRVTKPRGHILMKCQDYVSSGKLWLGVHYSIAHAQTLDMSVVDVILHVKHPRPQPPGRRQVHARRNVSTLLVLRNSPKKEST